MTVSNAADAPYINSTTALVAIIGNNEKMDQPFLLRVVFYVDEKSEEKSDAGLGGFAGSEAISVVGAVESSFTAPLFMTPTT